MHNDLKTNVKRCLCGILDYDTCPICFEEPEMDLHLLRDCGQSRHVRQDLLLEFPSML